MHVDDVVELRVHGVSGTPPEELLARPLVEQVAGDRTAGFFRPRLAAERTDSWPAGEADPQVRGPRLEGYAWGGITSGAPSRAFWLVLLPFTLINVAPRLHPPGPDPEGDAAGAAGAAGARRREWLLWYVSRVLALTLTVVLVVGFVGIGVDLVAWQCGGGDTSRCAAANPDWLMSRVLDLSTAHRVAVGVLLPLAALAFLWRVSGRTIRAYEDVRPTFDAVGQEPNDADPSSALDPGLRSRWMWQNYWVVRRLRALHVQVGLAAALGCTSAVLTTTWQWIDGLVAMAVGVYALVSLALPSINCRSSRTGWFRLSISVWAVLVASWAATLAWLVWQPDALGREPVACGPVDGRCGPADGLPRYADTILWLLFVELMLLLVLTATVAAMGRAAGTGAVFGAPGPRAAVRGWGTAALSLLAIFLASVFTAGSYLYACAFLTTGSFKPGFATISRMSTTFAVPEAILDAGLAYSVSVGVLALVLIAAGAWAGAVWLRIRPGSPLLVESSFAADYPFHGYDPEESAETTGRRAAVLRAMWLGRLVDVAGTVLGGLLLVGAALTYLVAAVLFAEHVLGAGAAARWLVDRDRTGYDGFFSPTSLQGTGAYLAVLTLLLLVVLGAAAFRAGPTRRSVGILWDLASFWPRVSHPLAPPCYAERTVPDLLTRIRWHVREGRGVVVAAHSQGTVISAAALLQLRTDDETAGVHDRTLPSVGLLTFGCVLRRLYGRFFPAYFGAAALHQVSGAVTSPTPGSEHRWRNLWRWTDYLGGPVACGPPPEVEQPWDPVDGDPDPVGASGLRLDLHLVDPPFDKAPGDTVFAPPGRHSAFWAVPEFPRAVALVAGLIPSTQAAGIPLAAQPTGAPGSDA